jgi:hypothetical protein
MVQAYTRLEDQGVAFLASCVVPGNKEDTHKHNHGQLPPELNLPHEREVAWEAAQEEPYELDVEQADIEE